MNRRITALGLLAVCAVSGCGGNGQSAPGIDGGNSSAPGTDGGNSPPPSSDQAFFTEFCAVVAPCCATNDLSANAAMCKASLGKLGISRDGGLRAACLDELRQRSATPACMPDIVDLGDACVRLFYEPAGTVAPGGTCQTAADCAGSPGQVTLCTDAICAALAPGKMGDSPCLGTEFSTGLMITNPVPQGSPITGQGFLCQKRAGLFCDFSDNHCKAVQPGGGACADSEGCASRVCNGSDGGGVGTCLSLPRLGEACTLDCAGDSYCDRATCVPKLAPGSACTADVQCSGTCAGADLCSGACTNGLCLPTVGGWSLSVWCGVTNVP